MLDELNELLAKKEWPGELQAEDWFTLSKLYYQCDPVKHNTFTTILASHTGIPGILLTNALSNLDSITTSAMQQEEILTELQESQRNATAKIEQLQKRRFVQHFDLRSLSISRAQWLEVIERFEQDNRQSMTQVYFISTLSSIKKVPYDVLVSGLTRHNPLKRSTHTDRQRSKLKTTGAKRPHNRIDETNPLLMQRNEEAPDLSEKLDASGVRQTEITHATPDKRYPSVVKTPGGTKARPLCTIGSITFFKALSPLSKEPLQGRVDISRTAKQPNVRVKRAVPVQFTATLSAIIERAGTIRKQSQFSQTKIKCSDVFRAHGIEIEAEHGRSHHWAHLIAHFLGDSSNISTISPEKEVINLVPSTAAANYNTLEAVESFIREKLMKHETKKIKIRVIPNYSEEALIPDMLEYRLAWTEKDAHGIKQECNEIFYINPQSYQRITHKMHESIAALRTYRSSQTSSSQTKDTENDTDNDSINDFYP